MEYLDISQNNFTGSLPLSLCKGERLLYLETDNNQLFGPIPESLGSCKSLLSIYMSSNFLSGSIPKGLFGLPNISDVVLSDNLLTGGFHENTDDQIFSVNLRKVFSLIISSQEIYLQVLGTLGVSGLLISPIISSLGSSLRVLETVLVLILCYSLETSSPEVFLWRSPSARS